MPRAAPPTTDPQTTDVTNEPTEVMQPGPPPGASAGEPGEDVELIEGEPVSPLR
jgi:hypothetical protein